MGGAPPPTGSAGAGRTEGTSTCSRSQGRAELLLREEVTLSRTTTGSHTRVPYMDYHPCVCSHIRAHPVYRLPYVCTLIHLCALCAGYHTHVRSHMCMPCIQTTICVRAYTHTFPMYRLPYVCTLTHVHTFRHAYTCTLTHAHTFRHAHVYTHTYEHVCMHVHVSVCVQSCEWTHVCAHTHDHVVVHACAHTGHMHMHVYTHLNPQPQAACSSQAPFSRNLHFCRLVGMHSGASPTRSGQGQTEGSLEADPRLSGWRRQRKS